MRYQPFEDTDWDALVDLRGLQKEMGRFFERIGGEGPQESVFPALNLWSSDTEAVVTAELPGVAVADLDISVLRDQLTLRGNRTSPELPDGGTRHLSEQAHGPFSRTIRLPFEVEDGKVTAAYHLGVLRLTLPRAEATRPRTIKIEPEAE